MSPMFGGGKTNSGWGGADAGSGVAARIGVADSGDGATGAGAGVPTACSYVPRGLDPKSRVWYSTLMLPPSPS
jgi:hypothetical protein